MNHKKRKMNKFEQYMAKTRNKSKYNFLSTLKNFHEF